jgi:hypothetical protein
MVSMIFIALMSALEMSMIYTAYCFAVDQFSQYTYRNHVCLSVEKIKGVKEANQRLS